MYSVFSSQAMLPGTKSTFYPETGDICLTTGSLFSLLARVAHISKIIYHETSTVAMSWLYAYPLSVTFCACECMAYRNLLRSQFFHKFSLTEKEISHIQVWRQSPLKKGPIFTKFLSRAATLIVTLVNKGK